MKVSTDAKAACLVFNISFHSGIQNTYSSQSPDVKFANLCAKPEAEGIFSTRESDLIAHQGL